MTEPIDTHGDEEMDEMDQPVAPTGAAPATPVPSAARAADFGDLGAATATGDPSALSLLFDLTMPVAIELGRTRMTVQEILGLGRGSVIQLDRLAGEPIDVFVGDRRFAEGEVVVVGEQFGIRITRIMGVYGRPAEAVA